MLADFDHVYRGQMSGSHDLADHMTDQVAGRYLAYNLISNCPALITPACYHSLILTGILIRRIMKY